MSFETDSFTAVEWLIRKHAPLLMSIGGELPRQATPGRVQATWKPRIHGKTIARMKRLRLAGETIGDIAIACRCSWRTAWRLSK